MMPQLQRALGLPNHGDINLKRNGKGAAATPQMQPYDPDSGFIIFADFAFGLPQKLQSGADTKKARLVYGMYQVSP